MHPASRRLLARLRQAAPRTSAPALRRLAEDLLALSASELGAAWREADAVPSPAPKRAAATALWRAVDRERRKLLMPAEEFAPLLAAALAKKDKQAEAALNREGRRSLAKLIAAGAARYGGDAVLAAARGIAAGRSLAYDIA